MRRCEEARQEQHRVLGAVERVRPEGPRLPRGQDGAVCRGDAVRAAVGPAAGGGPAARSW